MKILILTNRLPYPLNDGGNIATYYNLKYLKAQGHELTLFSLNTHKHYENPKNILPVVSTVETFDINTDLSKRNAIKALFSRLPYNAQRFYHPQCAEKIKQILQKNTFDIIQLEGLYMFLYEKELRTYSKAKLVYRSHNVEYKIWTRQAENEAIFFKKTYLKNISRKVKNLEIKCLKNVDAIIPISEDDALIISKIVPNKLTTTISAGIDMAQYKISDIPPQSNTLCFIGSLQWLPNLQGLDWFLNKVWKLHFQEQSAISFQVAGKNPPQYLHKVALNNFTFHGMVASQQAFLNKFDILLVPLLSGSGMRIKIIEALALKKCIIATTIGCEGIALTHKKNVWIANTPKEFVEAIHFLCTHQAVKNSIAQSGYQFVKENYDWQVLIKQFEQVYRIVLTA